MIPEKLRKIKLSDFDFAFNEEAIAQNPLEERDTSKLLEYKDGKISHNIFKNLPELLPNHSRLVLNNAKVIPARLKFYKATGAKIEVFLLEPNSPYTQFELALNMSKYSCTWQCIIGNLKRWKDDEVLSVSLTNSTSVINLTAQLISRQNQFVKFSWTDSIPFNVILDLAGKTPLPPYIKREANIKDTETYQTVFAKEQGAVAAPTAGLHFSEKVFEDLKSKEISTTELTLFVGAGTFAPVMVENMVDHDMHEEAISVICIKY
jgi:S-adenosylmethionine:tRNA ribosyltransferase-isomerase